MIQSRNLVLGWMAVMVVGLGSCGVTDDELRGISAWLTCTECTDGEREFVRDTIGSRAIGPLSEILLEFPPALLENRRRELAAEWRAREGTQADSAQFADLFLGNFEASAQRRAVLALSDLGATRVLERALRQASVIGLRGDVSEMIQRQLGPGTGRISAAVAATPATIVVAPASVTLEVGSSGVLRATVKDASGAILGDAVSWQSAAAGVVRVTGRTSQSALAEPQTAGGPVRVTASIGSVVGTAEVTSEAQLPAGYTIASLSGDGEEGKVDELLATPLVALVSDVNGALRNIVVTWTVQSGDAEFIDPSGVNRGRSWSDTTGADGKSTVRLKLGSGTRLVRVVAKIGSAVGRPSTPFRIRPTQ